MNDILNLSLPNGLTIIKNKYDSVNSINISLFFKVGALNEKKGVYGITHLAEHMFFRNLNGTPQKQLYYKTECMGTTLRGTTYRNCVWFDITVTKKHFKESILLISQLLKKFDWNINDFEKEKQIVKNQIQFKTRNFMDSVNEFYFDRNEMNTPIMGTISDVEKISLHDINLWKQQYFSCNNAAIVLSGCFNDSDYQEAISIFQQINNIGKKQNTLFFAPKDYKNRSEKSDTIIETDSDEVDIWITYDIDDIDTEEYYAARFLTSLLGSGDGSLLSTCLIEEHCLTDEVVATVDDFYGTSRIMIECTCKNQDIVLVLNCIFYNISLLKKEIPKYNYLSTIPFFTDNQILLYDDTRNFSHYLGWNRFIKEYDTWCPSLDATKYGSFTIDALIQYANKIFVSENMTINLSNNEKIYDSNQLNSLLHKLRQ